MDNNKELTSAQIARRKYEEKNREERKQANGQFSTRVPRKRFDEINEFLEKYNISKVDLIYAGFYALKRELEPRKEITKT